MSDEYHEMMNASKALALKARTYLEETTKPLGQKDDATTTIFRNYHLPGQGQEKTKRGLLDPEEYVVRVRNPHKFVQKIKAEQAELALNWEKKNLTGEPPLLTRFEVILGNPLYPEQCYRHSLLDANLISNNTVKLALWDNVEHDKGGISRAIIDSILLQGTRTGQLTKHQRAPIGVTTFPDDTLTIEIDPTQENLWIVVVSAAAIKAHMERAKI